MKTYNFLASLIVLILTSCSIDMAPPPTPAIPTGTALSASPVENTGHAGAIATPPYPATQIPVTWGNLNLTGRLVYTSAGGTGNQQIFRINVLNLATGVITPIFQSPKNSWISYTSVSPDGNQLLISYAAPVSENGNGGQDLYLLPLDGSKPPKLLFSPPSPYDHYVQAEWSPDGRYIYYVHYKAENTMDQAYPIYRLYRMSYPGGQPEKIAERALWPRVSADGTRLVYVSIDARTGENILFLAKTDGSHAKQVDLSGK